MDGTENSLYALLIGISKDVGEIKADVKNVKSDVQKYNSESHDADEKVSAKLEEYFDYAKNRQDGIKANLEKHLSDMEEDYNKKIGTLKDRVTVLENKPKNKLWELYDKFKGVLIAAIIAMLVGWCMKFISDLVKSVRPPVPIEQTYERSEK